MINKNKLQKKKLKYIHTIASISFTISNLVFNLKCIPLEFFDAILTFS